jgi:hypothetical protein
MDRFRKLETLVEVVEANIFAKAAVAARSHEGGRRARTAARSFLRELQPSSCHLGTAAWEIFEL